MDAGYIFTDFPIKNKDGNTYILKTLTFVIIDNDYGPILFDTGSPYHSDHLIEKLKSKFGISPYDVKWVFNTHMHPDHVGLNTHFRKARFVVSRTEVDYVNRMAEVVFNNGDLLHFLHMTSPDYMDGFDEVDVYNIRKYMVDHYYNILNHKDTVFIEDNPDIPQYIKIIEAGGHSVKHHAYIVKRKKCEFLIAGDAVSNRFIYKSTENDYRKGIHVDLDEFYSTRDLLKNFKGVIVPGHDKPFFTNTFSSLRRDFFDIDEIESG